MAKKKEEVVDLKPTSITEQELQSLQNLVNTMNRANMEIGQLETKKHSVLHQITGLQTQLQSIQKTFEETYGKVDINITDGTISYPEDVEANKEN
mgnify:FL=1|jgi:hypothetical protein|tara:strand:+ start:845 stop:1129 length:285 start_codon:yes stop_codon:yes gene_type:complete